MLKLNKDREHAIVFPPENGAHFMQGDFYFDQDGELVTHPDLFSPQAEKKAKRLAALEIANAAAKDARRKSLEAEGIDPDTVPETDDDEEIAEEKKKLDLKAWLRGEAKAIFPLVQAAIKEQHGFNAVSRNAAKEFLVGELGLVAPEAVRV